MFLIGVSLESIIFPAASRMSKSATKKECYGKCSLTILCHFFEIIETLAILSANEAGAAEGSDASGNGRHDG
jgi:hypothetical protein